MPLSVQANQRHIRLGEVDLFAPITFTNIGINGYLQNVYSHPDYAFDVLPYSFSHCIQLLQHSKESGQSAVVTQSIIKLFVNRVKEAPFIDAAMFADVIMVLPSLLDAHSIDGSPEWNIDIFKKNVHDIIYSSLYHQFDFFKQSPADFLAMVTQSVGTMAQPSIESLYNEAVYKTQLRLSLVRFLEMALSKITWSVTEPEAIWPSMQYMIQGLVGLYQARVITFDDLDDLLWTLTYRFGYFVTLFATHLPSSFYDGIKMDLEQNSCVLFQVEEQEDTIRTKEQYLITALLKAETQMRAQEHGIVLG